MRKGKPWQRAASAVLSVLMFFSTFSSNIAYALEDPVITDDSGVVTESLEAEQPADTVTSEAVSSPSEDDTASSQPAESENTTGAPEETVTPEATATPAPEPEATPTAEPSATPSATPEPTEEPSATPSPTPELTGEPSATPSPTPEATVAPEETESPTEEFVAVAIEDATEGQIEAELGQELTLYAHLNRDDVALSYQWYKRYVEPIDNSEYDESLEEYDYATEEPTTYGYLNEGKTPAETLAENPDATWSGIELYRAVADAMKAIGADPSNINIAFNTRNYALEGFDIHAENVDGNIVIYADSDTEHATATLDENNEFVFVENGEDHSTDEQEVAAQSIATPESASLVSSMLDNGWEAIEGATGSDYTHTVDEYDAYTTYRCVITIEDADYIQAAKDALIASGADTDKLTDDAMDNTLVAEATISIPSMENTEEDSFGELSLEDQLKARLALSGISTYAAGVSLDSQSNPQWVVGLSAGMEYLTADMYAKIYGEDGKGGWLAEGRITGQQADRMWSYISGNFSGYGTANVLNDDGMPTGGTRTYQSFTLTDGNKLEINSDWYGKTVYFRYRNKSIVGNTDRGAAVSVPAAGRGTTYKDAVQVLFCYTVEENGTVYPLTIKEYVNQATSNGYSANGLAHITLNTISCNTFNVDPDRYLKDAEGCDSFTTEKVVPYNYL